MRRLTSPVLICLVLLCPITFVHAAETTPLPVYPGGKVAMELNVTDKDFLPAIMEMITTFPKAMMHAILSEMGAGESPDAAGQAEIMSALFDENTLAELQTALAGLQSVSVVAYSLPKSAKLEQIPDFYMQKLGLSKGWTSTLRLEGPKGIVRVYAQPDLEGIFGFAAQPGSVGVFRTEGRVDVAAIGRVAAKWVPLLIMGNETTVEVEIPGEIPPDSEGSPETDDGG